MGDVAIADAPTDANEPPAHPDAQATVTDFLDYTDFFPSDLVRSLTLISKLDSLYLDSTAQAHDLTTTYSQLPTLPASQKPDPLTLRSQISAALERATHCRESAYAEAARLYDVAERHEKRLVTIRKKLQALPQPPSRDPTPVPVSPKSTRKELDRPQRITIHVDGARRQSGGAAQKNRKRTITIPGEVLPPANPDSPPPSSVSDYDSPPTSPGHMDIDLSDGRIKLPKQKKLKVPKLSFSRVRPPGVFGTNVHSSVAGISTSNALAKLDPPPSDAQPGSKWAPWLKLTEYEMALLRKQMKKNAIWSPSDTMIRRELQKKNRGYENFMKARKKAEETGEELLDEDPIVPGRPQAGELTLDLQVGADQSVVNRGMKLNEAKKNKREQMLREAEQTKLELDNSVIEATKTRTFLDSLFPGTSEANTPSTERKKKAEASKKRKRDSESSPQKPEVDNASQATTESAVRGPKKIKLAPPKITPAPPSTKSETPLASPNNASTTVSQVPLAPSGPSTPTVASTRKQTPSLPSPTNANPAATATPAPLTVSTAATTRSRRASVAPKLATSPTQATVPIPDAASSATGTISIRPRSSRGAAMSATTPSTATPTTTKAASAEPPTRRELRDRRRSSNASLPAVTEQVAAPPTRASARRGKKEAPGLVAEDASTSVARRKAKPQRKSSKATAEKENVQVGGVDGANEWDVDPNEPRYCFCDDVSWGTMIACENTGGANPCEREWFHLACVKMAENQLPGRRAKWYCEDCQKKLGVDKNGTQIETAKARKR